MDHGSPWNFGYFRNMWHNKQNSGIWHKNRKKIARKLFSKILALNRYYSILRIVKSCYHVCWFFDKIKKFGHTTPTQVYFADKYNISLSRQVTSQLPTIWRRLMKVNMKILQPAKIQPATITCKILNGIPALPPTTTLLIIISHSPFSTPTYFYVSQ